MRPAGVSGDSFRWEIWIMGRPSRYPLELRERAVRMVGEVRPDYESQWAAICAVSGKLGIGSADVADLGASGRSRHWPPTRPEQ